MNIASSPLHTERAVLFVSLKPDSASVEGLIAAGWQVVHAKTTLQADRMLERHAIMVGLIELPSGCTQQQLAELGACVSRTDMIWIAQVHAGQAEDEPVRRFILDYCFDFVTLPCLDERLAIVLGHAHRLSKL